MRRVRVPRQKLCSKPCAQQQTRRCAVHQQARQHIRRHAYQQKHLVRKLATQVQQATGHILPQCPHKVLPLHRNHSTCHLRKRHMLAQPHIRAQLCTHPRILPVQVQATLPAMAFLPAYVLAEAQAPTRATVQVSIPATVQASLPTTVFLRVPVLAPPQTPLPAQMPLPAVPQAAILAPTPRSRPHAHACDQPIRSAPPASSSSARWRCLFW